MKLTKAEFEFFTELEKLLIAHNSETKNVRLYGNVFTEKECIEINFDDNSLKIQKAFDLPEKDLLLLSDCEVEE